MSSPSGFRSKGTGRDRRVYPLFDTSTIGKPLKSSKSIHSSREAMHQMRSDKLDREGQERNYARYVASSLHGQGDVVTVNTPAKTTNLKLTTIKTDSVKFSQDPHNLNERSAYFEDAIKRGKTIPPILVHKLPDGKYEVVDGHARLQAYRNLGVKEIPAVENSIGDVLGKIGKGIASGARAISHVAKAGYQAAKPVVVKSARYGAKAARFGYKQVAKPVIKGTAKGVKDVMEKQQEKARIERVRILARKGTRSAQEYLLEHGYTW